MQKTVPSLTEQECQKFVAYFERSALTASGRTRQYRNQLMVLLMLDGGLRIGELLRLRISDLLFANSPVSAIDVNKKIAEKMCARLIPTTTRLRDSISIMNLNVWQPLNLPSEASPFLLDSESGTITARQVERMVSLAAMNSIGRDVHPHMLRHTFATRIQGITNTRTTQQALGHSSLQSTQIYTHVTDRDLAAAFSTLDGLNAQRVS